MAGLGTPRRPARVLRADADGRAARPRRRQRRGGRRGVRRAARRGRRRCSTGWCAAPRRRCWSWAGTPRGRRARARVDDAIASGAAVEAAERWVAAQGGEPRVGGRRRGTCSSGRRSSRRCRRRGAACWTASARSPSGSRPCGSAPGARARATRSIPRSASCWPSTPATRSAAGEPIAWVHARDAGGGRRGGGRGARGGAHRRRPGRRAAGRDRDHRRLSARRPGRLVRSDGGTPAAGCPRSACSRCSRAAGARAAARRRTPSRSRRRPRASAERRTTAPAPARRRTGQPASERRDRGRRAPGTFNWTLVDEAPLYADDSHALGAASNGEEVVGVGYRTGGRRGGDLRSPGARATAARGSAASSRSPPAPGLGGTQRVRRRGVVGRLGGRRRAEGRRPGARGLDVLRRRDVGGRRVAGVRGARRSGSAASRRAASRPPRDAIVVGGSAETIDDGAAVWRSTDGRAWERVDDDDLRVTSMHDVASDGAGFVGVGTDDPLRTCATRASSGSSEDGTDWRRVDVAGARRGRRGRRRWRPWRSGPGAGGSPGTSSPAIRPTRRRRRPRSRCGRRPTARRWQREPQDAIPYDVDVDVDDVAVLPGGEVVVVGTSTDVSLPHPAAVSWTRAADGTWRQQLGGALQGNGSVTGNGVAALGDVPVAVGTTVILDEPGEEDDGGVLNYDAVAFLGSPITRLTARCGVFTLAGRVRSRRRVPCSEQCARSASSPPTARGAGPSSGGCWAGSRGTRSRRRRCRSRPSRCSRRARRSARAPRARSCRSSASRCCSRPPSSPGRRGCRRSWPTSSPRRACWRPMTPRRASRSPRSSSGWRSRCSRRPARRTSRASR